MATIESPVDQGSGRPGILSPSRPIVWSAAVAVSLIIWLLSLQNIDLGQMNDYGLISVMPLLSFIALALLATSFCLALREDSLPDTIYLLHILVLVFMIFGITSLVQDLPRFESTWKHVGVADYVIRNGSVDPQLDAYFNWPGFFILLAFLTEVTGADSPMVFANWAPVALELLYLPALLMLFRRATDDRRLIWLSVWTFYIANWIGQDYLSPQGFNYFLYLVILAVLVTWFTVSSHDTHPLIRMASRMNFPTSRAESVYAWVAPPDSPAPPLSRRQNVALVGIVIGTYLVIASGHQLTPFALLGATALLVVFYRNSLVGMPIVMALIAGLWLRFMASAYWAGHGSKITDQFGALNDSVGANMTDRLSGSRGHEIVVYIRTVMTVAFWGLASIGCLRRIIGGHRDFTYALLAAAPFPLIAAQSYGGEMLLRVYLFSLPFMAFFVAAIFFRSRQVKSSWAMTAALLAVSLVALGLFFVTRFGNERQDYFTHDELAAAEFLYDSAPPDSVILAGTAKSPWKYRDYELHKHRTLSEDIDWDVTGSATEDLDNIADLLADTSYNGGFLFITRSQIANDELFGLIPFSLETLEQLISESPRFKLIYENQDARIYVLADNPSVSS